MADRRGVRASSRRKTPTPQLASTATSPQAERASRNKALRSASRDVEDAGALPMPTRRSARQASVVSMSDSEHDGKATRKSKRKPAKEAVGELTTVDEIDTEVAIEATPGTPTRNQSEENLPFRSPGAASEMSGTTAISSFSMVEAEFLEPKYMLKHLRKLCDAAEEFLEHLVPDAGSLEDDHSNIQEIQKPDSDFTEEYRDFDTELAVHLRHYKTDEHSYVHIRSIHRALFGLNHDVAASHSGLDLVLYRTNLLIFTKHMIYSDRTAKVVWDALRQLDHSFPSPFMRSLIQEANPATLGESALLEKTFELALDLRTQLAIMVLERTDSGSGLNPDEVIGDVFLHSEASQTVDGSLLRGWDDPALGGDDSSLPAQFESQVVERLTKVRESFPTDDESLQRGETVNLEKLENEFPWHATILRLLTWVRHRHREIHVAIEELGGATQIVRNVKQAIEGIVPVAEEARLPLVAKDRSRSKRTSFGRDRRRSGRKFDPNAPVDLRTIDALKARERISEANRDLEDVQQTRNEEQDVEQEAKLVQSTITKPQDDLPTAQGQQDDWQPAVGDEAEQVEEVPSREVVLARDEEVEHRDIDPTKPPASSADLLKILKAVASPQKENRPTSIFDRQANAQRVDFGDGFDDTQPTPGPSNRRKGKQPAEPSSRKRRRTVEEQEEDEDEDEDEDDAFQTETRAIRVEERRKQAPVAKKVRINPVSSGAPPSHQPPPRLDIEDDDYIPSQAEQEQEQSLSETEAPDMSEVAPPSTYEAQHQLAKEARVYQIRKQERKAREAWTNAEEEAFMEYMGDNPAKYSTILQYDLTEGYNVLQHRTQINLKDKARTMAINMIK